MASPMVLAVVVVKVVPASGVATMITGLLTAQICVMVVIFPRVYDTATVVRHRQQILKHIPIKKNEDASIFFFILKIF